MVYVGDVALSPYDARSAPDVAARSLQMVGWFAQQAARMIVVACKTATALAIEALRALAQARVRRCRA